jgi:hypothetical protein
MEEEMKRIYPVLSVVLALLLASIACNLPGGGQQATTEPGPVDVATLEAPAAGPTPQPPAEALDPAFGFKQSLVLALGTPRDYGHLATLMGDPFEILIWYGNGEQMSPAEAVEALQNAFLPPDNTVSFDEEVDIASVMGIDPHEFYDNPIVVDFMFTRGWGADGTDEALIVIGQKPDGDYCWLGILLAPGGFKPLGPGTTALDAFREQLIQAWVPDTRDLAYLESVMVDPFPVADVFAIYYDAPLPPADALARMQADGFLANTPPSIITNDLDVIDEQVNYDFKPLPPDAVDYVWVGQSDDGQYNVILVIGQDADGNYTFAAVRVIPVGFMTPVDFAREQILQAWMPDTRDLAMLESLMIDPFYIAGPMAFIHGPMTPAEAIAQMQADTVLATNIDPAVIETDPEIILQGTNYDVQGAIPDVIEYVWVGQSDDGQYNVILVIKADEDGLLKLAHVIMIPVGFQPPEG